MSHVTVNRGAMPQECKTRHSSILGQSERLVSVVAGVAVAQSALRSRSLLGTMLLLGASAGLLHRGASGHCTFSKGVDALNKMLHNNPEGMIEHEPREEDCVTSQSDDSFPASDAPSFTPVTGENGHIRRN